MLREESIRLVDYFRPLLPSFLQNYRREVDDNVERPSGPDRRLMDGAKLPPGPCQEFQPKFANVPLQDLDSFYKDTYVVVTGRKTLYRFSTSNALWILSPFNPIRNAAINISTHYVLTWIILLVVGINTIHLSAGDTRYFHSEITSPLWFLCVIVYTIEFLLKLVARGFIFDKFTYLRDPWNCLDFIILIFAYIGTFTGINNLAALRPLKLIANVSSWRDAVETVFRLIGKLLDVTILTTVILVMFALQGVHMYDGLLTQKCMKIFPGGENASIDSKNDWYSNITHWHPYPPPEYPNYPVCGLSSLSGTGNCPDGYHCTQGYGSNPDYGYTSYDNFLWGMLSTIRMMKLDFWEDLYRNILRAGGHWNKIYFLAVMFICSFYMLALIFGVVAYAISQMLQKRKAEKVADSRNIAGTSRTVSSFDFTVFDSLKLAVETCFSKCTDLLCKWDCCGACTTFRKWVSFIILDPFATVVMTGVVLFDIICFCVYHYNMYWRYNLLIFDIMTAITPIYWIEFFLKIVAMGPKPYFQDNWCKLEFVIMINSGFFSDGMKGPWVVFGIDTLHVLVILRLAQYWPTFRRLVIHIGKAWNGELLSFMVVIQLSTVTFAILGMSFFKKNYLDNDHHFVNMELPRFNFIDFGHSFIVIFRALCGEWIETMWDCSLASHTQYECIPFFLIVVFLGNMFTLTFFILLYHQVVSPDGDETNEEVTPKNKLVEAVNRVKGWFGWNSESSEMGRGKAPSSSRLAEEDEMILNRTTSMEEEEAAPSPYHQHQVKEAAPLPPSSTFGNISRMAGYLTENKWFNPVMVIIILFCSYVLNFDDLDVKNNAIFTGSAILAVDIIFTLVILVEAILRIGAKGFASYFMDAWRLLDVFIVVASILGCILSESSWELKSLRGFRILMIVSRLDKLKNVVGTISPVVRKICWMIPACGALWLVFASSGLLTLNGRFHKCYENETGETLEYWEVAGAADCRDMNWTWSQSIVNFDHIPNAFLSLFLVSTFKGWIGIMNDAIDTKNRNSDPGKEHYLGMYVFFVLFIIFGVFLCFTWLLGEAVKELDKQRKKKAKGGENSLPFFMSDVELNYASALRLRTVQRNNSVIPPAQGNVERILRNLCENKKFEFGMCILMISYLVFASTYHYRMSAAFYDVHVLVELAFVILITLECIFKIVAFRRHYFTEKSNLFDFILILFAVVCIFMVEFAEHSFSATPFLFVKAVKTILGFMGNVRKGMRSLLLTMGKSLPEVAMTSVVLVIVIWAYSTCGMLAFKHVKLRAALDEVHNFQSFHQAGILMIQITTAAGWDGILMGIRESDDCEKPLVLGTGDLASLRGDCGNTAFAVVFLISFMVLTFFLVAFMFLTVILEYFYQRSQENLKLTQEDFRKFDEVWEHFDPEGSHLLKKERLPELLDSLKPPLQIPKENEVQIHSLGVPIVEGDMVNSEDVLTALIRWNFEK